VSPLNWFGPRNSLVLAYDHLDARAAEEFETQIEEVGRFYKFAKLSELAQPAKRSPALGRAAIVFLQARRSVLMRAVPYLVSREIPFTLFLDPECIGLNTLPFEEEMALLRAARGGQISLAPADEAALWHNPAKRNPAWAQARRDFGPLPIDNLDPMRFFSTWGQIVDIHPSIMEAGLHLFAHPASPDVAAGLAFVRTQVRRDVSVAFCPYPVSDIESRLSSLGLVAAVSSEYGEVRAGTPRYSLPRFKFEAITVPQE
jgi:hypothetical protein